MLEELHRSVDEEGSEQTSKGALLDLIEVEKRVEADLASATVEAERIVESARSESRSTSVDGDALLDAELEKLRESIERECETTIRDIEDRARTEEARYQRVAEDEQQELARWVAECLVGIGAQS